MAEEVRKPAKEWSTENGGAENVYASRSEEPVTQKELLDMTGGWKLPPELQATVDAARSGVAPPGGTAAESSGERSTRADETGRSSKGHERD